ncbi:MAG TPA: hypothetical protein VFM55_09765 [Micromonosporaceae bacterium]|nr:hypothetical protein [Micromonosporaceae bacterium]
MSAGQAGTERLWTTAADGRRVAVWRTSGGGAPGGPVVVLAAGFARRMRHVGAVALYLARNSAVVYRYDPLDHVGLSDGEIRDYTFTSSLSSMRAVVDLAVERERAAAVTLVAASLAGRVAYRLAGLDPRVAAVATLVGVVDVRRTLVAVLGADYTTYELAELPADVAFEQYRIDPRPLWLDHRDHGWTSIEGTIDDLRRTSAPVTNFWAADDDWVRPEDVERAFEEGTGGPRRLLELPFGQHDLSGNPVAARVVMRALTEVVVGDAVPGGQVADPSFEEIVELAVSERRAESAQLAEDLEGTRR